jgi:hypothetical protein
MTGILRNHLVAAFLSLLKAISCAAGENPKLSLNW